jgi:outer membrane protein assembly factor BamE
MKRLALSTIALAAGAFLSSGCVYKMSIQQGNYLVAESVQQLKEGMTRSQVRFLLGTPMVPVAFDDSRWDYYYFFSSKRVAEPLKRRLTVYFEDDKVARFENQGVPTQSDLAQLEADLRKAIAETRKNRRRSLWQRMTGRGGDIPAETSNAPASDPKAEPPKPDPLPPAQPLPEPAGTPSGPT